MRRFPSLFPVLFVPVLLAGCVAPPRYVVDVPNAPPLSHAEVARRSVDASAAVAAYKERLAAVDVRDLDAKLEVLSMAPPDYPLKARLHGIEGIVRVRFVIGVDGRAEDISLIRSAHTMLNSAAVSAVQQWRFKPMRLHGNPVRVSVEQEIPFVLAK